MTGQIRQPIVEKEGEGGVSRWTGLVLAGSDERSEAAAEPFQGSPLPPCMRVRAARGGLPRPASCWRREDGLAEVPLFARPSIARLNIHLAFDPLLGSCDPATRPVRGSMGALVLHRPRRLRIIHHNATVVKNERWSYSLHSIVREALCQVMTENAGRA